jgi:low temperature requirement protein LtrA
MTQPQRRADWFELFFDLVFVVAVSILTQGLHGDPGWAQYGTLLALFFPAWWAWANLVVSVNVFGAVWTRVLLLLAVPGLGVMAAAAPDGLGTRAWAFALGAAWVNVTIFAIWRTRTRLPTIPWWRPVAYCLVPAGLWAVSAVLPAPARFGLWVVAIVLQIAMLTWRRGQTDLYGRLVGEHLVERVGLFLVIVLGVSVFGVVTGLAAHFTAGSAVAALGGFTVSAMLATSFFRWGAAIAEHGFAGAQDRGAYETMRETVMYLPFALVSAVVVVAAALTQSVAEPTHVLPAGHRYGLAVGLATYYLTNAVVTWRLGGAVREIRRWLIPSLLLPLVVVGLVATFAAAWVATLTAAAVTTA